jgi:hypothetical protein
VRRRRSPAEAALARSAGGLSADDEDRLRAELDRLES